MTRWPVVTTALTLVLIGCHSEHSEFSAQDEAAVKAVADSAVRYQLAGNWDAWAGLFAEDGVLYPPNAPAVKGRSALVAWAKQLPKVEQASFTNVEVVGEGRLSYGTSGYRSQLHGMPPDTGKQLWVSRRAGGGKWEVVAVSFNSDLRPPSSPGVRR
jgi:ketosteroid isomerase-like protein